MTSTTTTHVETRAASTDIFGRSWAGREVVVVGLGKSGLAAAELLCRVGARVRATDARETEGLRATREALIKLGVDRVELGAHSQAVVDGADVIVVSPGVPDAAGPIRYGLAHRLPIISEIELAFHFCRSPLVAVTGTNGKSTAVTMMGDVLRAAGRPAIACGNLGTPFSSILPEATPETVVIVEVSSFQLLWCDRFRPHVGVLLNIGMNHLDRHEDAQTYLAAKTRLFTRQTPDDWAVLNGSDARVTALGKRLRARRVWFGGSQENAAAFHLGPATQRVFTPNAQAVLQVARLFEVADPLTWQTLREFRGLEHRLEPVATIRGVHFVNDSKSTTPDSALYAVTQTTGDVVVVVGGRDKGLDFDPLIARLHEADVNGVVLIGESRARLRSLLNGTTRVREAKTLEEAVRAAAELASPGSTVLFSPACASFDMFRNFEERGRTFKTIVRGLADAVRGKGSR